jgi:hypothetical protein
VHAEENPRDDLAAQVIASHVYDVDIFAAHALIDGLSTTDAWSVDVARSH